MKPDEEQTLMLLLQQEESGDVVYDVGMGNYAIEDLENMLPNTIQTTIGPFPGDDCHKTGTICG